VRRDIRAYSHCIPLCTSVNRFLYSLSGLMIAARTRVSERIRSIRDYSKSFYTNSTKFGVSLLSTLAPEIHHIRFDPAGSTLIKGNGTCKWTGRGQRPAIQGPSSLLGAVPVFHRKSLQHILGRRYPSEGLLHIPLRCLLSKGGSGVVGCVRDKNGPVVEKIGVSEG
jgi:hypothetical protein